MKRDSFLCSTSLLHAQNLASAGLVLQGAEPSGVQAPKDGHVGVLLFLPASAILRAGEQILYLGWWFAINIGKAMIKLFAKGIRNYLPY